MMHKLIRCLTNKIVYVFFNSNNLIYDSISFYRKFPQVKCNYKHIDVNYWTSPLQTNIILNIV